MIHLDKFSISQLPESVRRGFSGFLLTLSFLCLLPVTLGAHAFPDHSDPKVGATVKVCPDLIRIWFDSNLEPMFSKLVVRGEDDRRVDNDDSRVDPADPKLLEVSVPKLDPGQYRVMWSVVARDGHRTYGDFTFKVK